MTPTPELVIIQSIDNDIQCDGSDPQNYGPYRQKLTGVMDTLDPGPAQRRRLLRLPVGRRQGVRPRRDEDRPRPHHRHRALRPDQPRDPQARPDSTRRTCSTWSTTTGRIVTGGVRAVPDCRTDKGVMQTMQLDAGDLAADLNHLSVAGHHKMAALVWQALYG